jgi:predicted histidine transporter YuiF (NhaC family)
MARGSRIKMNKINQNKSKSYYILFLLVRARMRMALLPTHRAMIPMVSEIKPKSPQPLLLLIDFLSMERTWRKAITNYPQRLRFLEW